MERKKSERDLGTWFKAADTEITPSQFKIKTQQGKKKSQPRKTEFFLKKGIDPFSGFLLIWQMQ